MPFRRLSLTEVFAVLLAAGALVPAGSGASAARTRHHRHGSGHAHPLRRPPPPGAPVATPGPATHEFYPENVEGGVPGNLPFNNQIRKFTDPLNANGGR